MHVGMICPELTGHLNPMTALGKELCRRGRRVSFLVAPRVRERVERAGFGVLPVGAAEDAEIASDVARIGELSGMSAMRLTGRMMARMTELALRDVPRLIETAGIDALVVDQFSPAGALVAERLGVPYAIACNALACYIDPRVPPPPIGWRYRAGWLARLRNRLGNFLAVRLFEQFSGTRGRSPLLLIKPESFGRGLVQVAQQPEFFDFPRGPLPDHFHYTAPWHAPGRDADIDFPWEKLDGRPLVYASLGTLQNNLRHVYAAIVEAARGLDVQMVLALGNPRAMLDFAPPENVIVAGYAPQLPLLERAAVAVTHAGLNTALECLARDVPMVCLPVTNDQPGVARRVEWLGAGEVIPVGRARADRIRASLRRVLAEPAYREAAAKCRARLAGRNGPALAADLVLRAFTTRARVPARG
jgi:MGT family glycosyltransferase